jgi:uncharacterized protein YndB with AHSA1/START domain
MTLTGRTPARGAELNTTESITIRAPIEEVWNILTTPALIKQWFFGVDTETDWKVGGPLIHRGEYRGKPYEDKGRILRFDPPRLLVHSHWSEGSGRPDSPENYQEVSWVLSSGDGLTELTVAESNLPSEEMTSISEKTWRMVLRNIKALAEQEASVSPRL